MGSEGQFDPSHFAVYLLEALKDPQVQSALNKSIDYSKINDTVSIEIGRHIKILEEAIKNKTKKYVTLKPKTVILKIVWLSLNSIQGKKL